MPALIIPYVECPGDVQARQQIQFQGQEKDLIILALEEWEDLGILCNREVVMKCLDGNPRRLDVHIMRGDQVALVEFKKDAADFMQGVGQLIGYESRMRLARYEDHSSCPYAKAYENGKTSLFVATASKPHGLDIHAALAMQPSIQAWWLGCPPPI